MKRLWIICTLLGLAGALYGEVVTRVIDGDTLELATGEKVRLLGVDTPETKHTRKGVEYYGVESSVFVKRLVLSNRVTLKYDGKKKKTGKYGRVLAYVYLPDGRMLNALLIECGYGFATPEYRFGLKDVFMELEAEAREQGRGIWKEQGRDEYRWLLNKNQPHLRVIPMAGNRWGVLFAGYGRFQLSHQELIRTLKQVRGWTERYQGEELAGRLSKAGWSKVERP